MPHHYSTWAPHTSDRLSGFDRLKVDAAQTGFFEGREFRSFYEYSIPAGGSATVRFTSPVDFILFGQSLTIDSGGVRLNAIANGVSSGSWTPLPVIGKNRMSSRRQPFYAAQATLDVGGSYTGGTVVETIRAFSDGLGASRQTVGGGVQDERGLPAGVYHLHLANINAGDATGVYAIWWEERPSSA